MTFLGAGAPGAACVTQGAKVGATMRAILTLAILGWAATANAGGVKWRFCGAADDAPVAFYVNIADVRGDGEFKRSEIMALFGYMTDVAEFTVSCRTFYFRVGKAGAFSAPRNNGAHLRATQILCGTDAPSEGGK